MKNLITFSSFKFIFRNIWKTRGYSFLNIAGLAMGIALASLIFLWVENEFEYNDYFKNKTTIYEVKNEQTYDGLKYVFSSTPGPLAPAMLEDFPEFKNASRSTWLTNILFDHEDTKLFEKGLYVDPKFLDIFSVNFKEGNLAGSLHEPNQVVISESMALRLFNDTHVVGKTIRISAKEDRIISGVFEDLPTNVSVSFDWLMPFQNFFDANTWLTQWGSNAIRTFVQIHEHVDVNSIAERFYPYINTKSGYDTYNSKLRLYPMERWKLYNNFDSSGHEIEGNIKYVRLFSIIAWIILFIACINFMNLSTARSQKRAKEIGVKKVVGANRIHLILQFLNESFWIALLAGFLAIGIAALLLPFFNEIVGQKLSLGLNKTNHWIFLLVIVTFCGLFAGSYPAFYLSSFKPIGAIKSARSRLGSAGLIRKGLVILQFSASIILIICTLLIYQQIRFAQSKELGFDKSNIVTSSAYPKLISGFSALRHQLVQKNLVEEMSLSSDHILNFSSNTSDFNWEGKVEGSQILITITEIDQHYFKTHKIDLLAGRTFREDLASDSGNVIINRKMAEIMGIEDNPIGKKVSRSWGDFTIVGMVDNFLVTDIYSPDDPVIFNPGDSEDMNIISMRLKESGSGDLQANIAQIETIFKEFNPEYPFVHSFVDERFERMFQTESLIGKLTWIFAGVAVFISCLGLFGLAAFTAENRTKEIGIRKVLGASITNLTQLLTKEFLLLVIISCVIAFPVSYWIMEKWLDNYSYRIEIEWWVFIIAAGIALFIALLTVGGQALRASISNPIKSLRTE